MYIIKKIIYSKITKVVLLPILGAVASYYIYIWMIAVAARLSDNKATFLFIHDEALTMALFIWLLLMFKLFFLTSAYFIGKITGKVTSLYIFYYNKLLIIDNPERIDSPNGGLVRVYILLIFVIIGIIIEIKECRRRKRTI